MLKIIREYTLPLAILLALIFHKAFASISWIAPYVIFCILILNFSAIRLKSLRMLPAHWKIMAFQLAFALGAYAFMRYITGELTLAQGMLIGILCPVAASSSVVVGKLGGDMESAGAYTVADNLMVTAAAPLIFSFLGNAEHSSFLQSFLMILAKISPTLALPFFIMLALQSFAPRLNDKIKRFSGLSFYLWAFVLLPTLGKTFDFIFLHGQGREYIIVSLAALSLFTCTVLFSVGQDIGAKYGLKISGGQMSGQKNSTLGIWMASIWLSPLSSVFLAFYSVWQNLFNSFELWEKDRGKI